MGFVATGNGDTADKTLTNDGFFPDIDISHFRATMREDGTVPNARLEAVLLEAMADVNTELEPLKARYTEPALADTQPQLNGESIAVQKYRRAVYCHAKANLLERYTDYDSTRTSTGDQSEKRTVADDYRRDQRWAVRDLLKRTRTTVELI